jgi:hypothetical protein
VEHVPLTEKVEVGGQGDVEKALVFKRWIDLPARDWWSGDVPSHHPSYDPAQQGIASWGQARLIKYLDVMPSTA